MTALFYICACLRMQSLVFPFSSLFWTRHTVLFVHVCNSAPFSLINDRKFSSPAFKKKRCQHFWSCSQNFHGPSEYFAVLTIWTFLFYVFMFYSSFMHFFINTWMWVGFIKKKKFEQKAENIAFLSKTTSGWDSERWSKYRWSRSLPSTPPKLTQSYTTSWVNI